MSFNFGSSDSKQKATQTIAVPEANPDEKELRRLNIEVAQENLRALKQAQADQAAFAASPQAALEKQIQQKGLENLQARLTGQAPILSPEEEARINTIYGNAQTQGEDDLMRFARDLAASRGMTVTDSPIGGEVLAQRGKMGQSLQAAKANAILNQGNASSIFNQQVADFAQQLQQRAFQNRLALSAMGNPYALQSGLANERLAGAGRSMTGSGSQRGYGYGVDVAALMGGAGGAMRGYNSGLSGGGGGGDTFGAGGYNAMYGG